MKLFMPLNGGSHQSNQCENKVLVIKICLVLLISEKVMVQKGQVIKNLC